MTLTFEQYCNLDRRSTLREVNAICDMLNSWKSRTQNILNVVALPESVESTMDLINSVYDTLIGYNLDPDSIHSFMRNNYGIEVVTDKAGSMRVYRLGHWFWIAMHECKPYNLISRRKRSIDGMDKALFDRAYKGTPNSAVTKQPELFSLLLQDILCEIQETFSQVVLKNVSLYIATENLCTAFSFEPKEKSMRYYYGKDSFTMQEAEVVPQEPEDWIDVQIKKMG